ncbi:MAG: hypothetical protein U0835_11140 [Isosphaeraceae bacterium]
MPRGLLGMLCLVVAVEGLLFQQRARIGAAHADHETAVSLSKQAVDGDLLCFGDSLLKCALFPRVVEEHSGIRAYNLAIAGGTAPVSYAMLCRALDQGVRPRAVMVDFESLLLGSHVLSCQRAVVEVAGPAQILEYAWEVGRPEVVPYWLTHLALRSVRVRHEIRTAVRDALQARQRPQVQAEAIARRNWEENRGAFDIAGSGAPPDLDRDTFTQRFLDPVWNPGTKNLAFVRKFLQPPAPRGCPWWSWCPPLHPEVQAGRDRLGLESRFDRRVLDVVARMPHVTVLDGRGLVLPATSFVDSKHMNHEGGVVFSRVVAEALMGLERGATRPQMVRLKLPTGQPRGKGVEGEEESVLAADGKAPTRR